MAKDIDRAMQEQLHTMESIYANIEQASDRSGKVVQNMDEVADMTRQVGQNSETLLHASQTMQEKAGRIQQIIARFLDEVAQTS